MRLIESGGCVDYTAGFIAAPEADAIFARLMQEIPFAEEEIKIFGKPRKVPRLVSWHGDKAYRYSQTDHPPQPWTPTLLDLKAKAEQATGARYNSVLCNLYRHGQDSMGWHADDEASLGPAPTIASLSFGAARRFRLRRRDETQRDPQTITLDHGSLLVMHGDLQKNWQHALPKTAAALGPRINLTYRWVY